MPDLKLGFAMLNPTYRASLGRNYDRRQNFSLPHGCAKKSVPEEGGKFAGFERKVELRHEVEQE